MAESQRYDLTLSQQRPTHPANQIFYSSFLKCEYMNLGL